MRHLLRMFGRITGSRRSSAESDLRGKTEDPELLLMELLVDTLAPLKVSEVQRRIGAGAVGTEALIQRHAGYLIQRGEATERTIELNPEGVTAFVALIDTKYDR